MKYGFHGFSQPLLFFPFTSRKNGSHFHRKLVASAPLKSPSAAHTDNKAVQMSGGASPVAKGIFFCPQKMLGQMGPPLEMRDFSRRVWEIARENKNETL